MTDRMIRYRVDRGRWRRRYPGVYEINGCPASWHQDVWAAVLAVGLSAVVTHETALLLHGVPHDQLPRYPVTLTVPRGEHHRVAGATVHQIDDLIADDVTEVDGLRVSLPERAIVEAASAVKARIRLGALLDHLIVDRRTTIARVAGCLARVARPGKPGVAILGAVLDERGPGFVPPASKLEELLFSVLADAGLPEPVRQIQLPGRGAVKGLVDAGYLDARLLLEADGRRWHTRQTDLRRDHRRDAESIRAGWATLRFLYEQLIEEPNEIAATVTETRNVRLQQFGIAA